MQRRILLSVAVAPIMLTAAKYARASARRPEPRLMARRLQLRHAASGARFSGTYHDGRALDPVALADLSMVLADSRTGAVHPFDPSVIDILWEVGQRARVEGEFVVFSGYRTPETNAAVCGAGNSQHLRVWIPIQGGQVSQPDGGHPTDLMAATLPI